MKLKLLKQQGHKCLLYAAAMVLKVDPDRLEGMIGHDGQAVMYPDLPMPARLKGHHMQEILDCAHRFGYGFILVELMPRSGPQGGGPDQWHTIYNGERAIERFRSLINDRLAILIGQNPETGANHAYAWDGEMVFDPNGRYMELSETPIREAWILTSWK